MVRSAVTIVGASLAGYWAAETLRRDGFEDRISLIGDEHHALGLALAGKIHHIRIGGTGLDHVSDVGEPGPRRIRGPCNGVVALHRGNHTGCFPRC